MNTQPMFMMPMPSDIAAKAERYKAANGVPLDAIVLSILRYVLDAETVIKPTAPELRQSWRGTPDPNEPPFSAEDLERMDRHSAEMDAGEFVTLDELRAMMK